MYTDAITVVNQINAVVVIRQPIFGIIAIRPQGRTVGAPERVPVVVICIGVEPIIGVIARGLADKRPHGSAAGCAISDGIVHIAERIAAAGRQEDFIGQPIQRVVTPRIRPGKGAACFDDNRALALQLDAHEGFCFYPRRAVRSNQEC